MVSRCSLPQRTSSFSRPLKMSMSTTCGNTTTRSSTCRWGLFQCITVDRQLQSIIPCIASCPSTASHTHPAVLDAVILGKLVLHYCSQFPRRHHFLQLMQPLDERQAPADLHSKVVQGTPGRSAGGGTQGQGVGARCSAIAHLIVEVPRLAPEQAFLDYNRLHSLLGKLGRHAAA